MEEKTAEELFEDLGLWLERETPFDFEVKNDDDKVIKFNKERREIACFNYYGGFEYLTLQELQAINKKCEELKWIQKNNIECYFIRKDSFDYITYECSNCEEEWCLTDGTPEENCYNYCPKCGAKIIKIIERGE